MTSPDSNSHPTPMWSSDSGLSDWEAEGGAPAPEPKSTRDKKFCPECGYRLGVSCTCGLTFAEKIKTVGIDAQALRIFHGN